MKLYVVFVAVLLIVVTIQSANGIKCYVCVDCKDDKGKEQDCGMMDACFRGTEVGGIIVRGCSWKGMCDGPKQPNAEECSTCTENLCNAGTTFGPIALLIVVAAIASCGVLIG